MSDHPGDPAGRQRGAVLYNLGLILEAMNRPRAAVYADSLAGRPSRVVRDKPAEARSRDRRRVRGEEEEDHVLGQVRPTRDSGWRDPAPDQATGRVTLRRACDSEATRRDRASKHPKVPTQARMICRGLRHSDAGLGERTWSGVVCRRRPSGNARHLPRLAVARRTPSGSPAGLPCRRDGYRGCAVPGPPGWRAGSTPASLRSSTSCAKRTASCASSSAGGPCASPMTRGTGGATSQRERTGRAPRAAERTLVGYTDPPVRQNASWTLAPRITSLQTRLCRRRHACHRRRTACRA